MWIVRGAYRVGLFALPDIPAGAELTADYRLGSLDGKEQPCNCGEAVCRESMMPPPRAARAKNAQVLKKPPSAGERGRAE